MPRQGYCTIYLNKAMPFAVGKLLISNFETEMKLNKLILNDIKNRILKEFKKRFSDESLANEEWMDKKSKNLSLSKANKVESFIGYDEFLLNHTFMNQLYNVKSFYISSF
jgi:hypothetical protein